MIQTNGKGGKLKSVTVMNTDTHKRVCVCESGERERLYHKSFLESDQL